MSKIKLIHQEGALRSFFPESNIQRKGEDEIIWIHNVTPSPLSASYTLKLHYISGKGADVYVIEPKPLALAVGKSTLPHVYSLVKQELCLWYPKDKEWNNGMYYVKTLIPWACEWLFHYEIWLATGIWHGGGIEHDSTDEKIQEKLNE